MSPKKPVEPSRKRAAATLGVVADADAFAVRSVLLRVGGQNALADAFRRTGIIVEFRSNLPMLETG